MANIPNKHLQQQQHQQQQQQLQHQQQQQQQLQHQQQHQHPHPHQQHPDYPNNFVTVIPLHYSLNTSSNDYPKPTPEFTNIMKQLRLQQNNDYRLDQEAASTSSSSNVPIGNFYSLSGHHQIFAKNPNISGTCSHPRPCDWEWEKPKVASCAVNISKMNHHRVDSEMSHKNFTYNNSPNPMYKYGAVHKDESKNYPSVPMAAVPPVIVNNPSTSKTAVKQNEEEFSAICLYLYSKLAFYIRVEDNPSLTADMLCQAVFTSEELNFNKTLAGQVFALWISSPLLEIQLKGYQKPYKIIEKWDNLSSKYGHISSNQTESENEQDEPLLYLRRNVFFPQNSEDKIKDPKILELLYEEAKYNILKCRYPCEISHYVMLGGLQARIELGSYNPQIHNLQYFREEQSKYLPLHVRKSENLIWLPISSKSSAEVRLFEQFKRIPATANNKKLIRKYLDFCWSLPFYGCAFFDGQIEQPVRGLVSYLTRRDVPVIVAINSKGIHVIDDIKCMVILGLKYEEFNWEQAKPSGENDPDSNCLPCLFVQFMIVENGTRVSKILQIFSKQAELMDSLITCFVKKSKTKASLNENETNSAASQSTNINAANFPSLSTKLNKMTLATFDENGLLIGQTGSLSFT